MFLGWSRQKWSKLGVLKRNKDKKIVAEEEEKQYLKLRRYQNGRIRKTEVKTMFYRRGNGDAR